jgi:HD-GYP domain-containing protein (c-di-GMP phosphodiesterase class II)
MKLAIRTFLFVFVPVAVLVSGSLWAVQQAAVAVVHDAVRNSLRSHQQSAAEMRDRNEQQNRRYLQILGENAALRAGLQLLAAEPWSNDARLTVQDQLRQLCSTAGIDFLVVSTADGIPLAGVLRRTDDWQPLNVSRIRPPAHGFFLHNNSIYQVTSVPITQAEEIAALLSVGEKQDLARLGTPTVLLRDGEFVGAAVPGVAPEQLQTALAGCVNDGECELTVKGESYLSMADTSVAGGHTYTLRSLVNLDSALRPVQALLRRIFVFACGGAILAALVLTVASSASVTRPIKQVVAHLQESERTGSLTEFDLSHTGVREIRELMEGFNRAAHSVRESRTSLQQAYVEFVGSLASALDARDPYTAGHSGRVSHFSCAIAAALELGPAEVEELRIGALLHDIGKIGIEDAILRKPNRLTDEEFRLIQEHPAIGRRILEGVNGFAPYLDVVELHHENWDGTGYPLGLRGHEVPLTARIVHVADAYDAMTSDRPYRPGMKLEAATQILLQNAGTQFDPVVVNVFARLLRSGAIEGPSGSAEVSVGPALQRLAAAINEVRDAPVLEGSHT